MPNEPGESHTFQIGTGPQETACSTDESRAGHAMKVGAFLKHLQLIETGSTPKAELSVLRELLNQAPQFGQVLADPTEAQHYPGPFAYINAYKHRLHALRCEFVTARFRIQELSEQRDQLHQQRDQLHQQRDQLQQQRDQLQQQRDELDRRLSQEIMGFRLWRDELLTSRAWKMAVRCSRIRQTFLRWFGRAGYRP